MSLRETFLYPPPERRARSNFSSSTFHRLSNLKQPPCLTLNAISRQTTSKLTQLATL